MSEKTLNEQLLETFRAVSRRNRHKAPHRPTCRPHRGPEEMHGPDGKHGPMPPHGPRRGFPRERVLSILLEQPEGMHQKEILEKMHIRPSSLSELIDKLESDRYVERNADENDRRTTLITLTEKGKARAYEVLDERKAEADERFKALTEEEKKQLLVLLQKLLPEETD